MVTFAIRSGISIASTYAVKSVSKFIQDKVPPETLSIKDRQRLLRTKNKLQTRIEIVSSAIDLIKLVAARGNTNLSSTLRLTKDLKVDIDAFDTKIQGLLEKENATKDQILDVENDMLDLLERIEEVIPLINLSLATSGANLNGSLSAQVSPGRLLQASDYLNISNREFLQKGKELQVGPTFNLTQYSIFYHRGRIVNNNLSEISWKENITRTDVSIWRTISKKGLGYEYVLKIKENFNDGRYHDDDESEKIIEIDVATITRLFFSASGKLLKLEDRSSPVLVLKINHSFDKLEDGESEGDEEEEPNEENWIEWLALGEYEQLYDYSEDEDDSGDAEDVKEEKEGEDKNAQADLLKNTTNGQPHSDSLSLLEYILRLSILQANDQLSILEIDDERLSLYLHDENPDSKSIEETERDEFNSNNSTPVKIVSKSQQPKKFSPSNNISTKLKKVAISDDNEASDPSTPQKKTETKGDSPIPGEISTSLKLTPWERDKLSKFSNSDVPATPSMNSILRKKVLKRNMQKEYT